MTGKKGQRKAVTQASNPKKDSSKKKVEKKVTGKKNTNKKQSNAKNRDDKGGHEKSNAKKGGLVTLVRHGSDDDSLGLDNDNDFVQAVEEARKESKTKRPLVICVSSAFTNVRGEFQYYIVIFPKPGKTFYMKAEHWQNLLSVVHKKRIILNPKEDGAWIDTGYY